MPAEPQPKFQGFDLPEQNWFRLPNSWTDITCDISSLGELKVVEYVLRHTWGYREYGLAKRISTDEFMHGRRHKDGSRMDRGTGLAKQSVIDGLRRAVEHGYLLEDVDRSDKGRVKKYYSLRMNSAPAAPHRHTDTTPSAPSPKSPNQNPDPDVQNLDRGVENLDIRGEESRHRSEKDTIDQHTTVTVNGNGTSTTTSTTHPVADLSSLNHPPERTELLSHDIAEELGDRGSLRFYALVADRVPERVIRRHLAEVTEDGAENPASLFNYRMRRYAERQLLDAQNATVGAAKRGLFIAPRNADSQLDHD